MFSMWTSTERQIRTEFEDEVTTLLGSTAGEPLRLVDARGADPLRAFDVRMGNKALDAGYALRWVAETVVRRRLSRVYGAGLVATATKTTTGQR